jgi:methyltransferase (TIGR00027 family)
MVGPISKTAYYCCGVRMHDAESSRPICGDAYAKIFMDDAGIEVWNLFKKIKMTNATHACRHRIFDDILKEQFLTSPETTVIIIGAGFDTRAYRLGGGIWIEVDTHEIITYKNERLPIAQSKNPLTRIVYNYPEDSLLQCLSEYKTNEPVIIVIEGVLFYLDDASIVRLIETLRELFPRHRLVCDLMRKSFYRRYGRGADKTLRSLGNTVIVSSDTPEQVILEQGYRVFSRVSIMGRAAELGAFVIPAFFIRTFLGEAINGYSIFVFETSL